MLEQSVLQEHHDRMFLISMLVGPDLADCWMVSQTPGAVVITADNLQETTL